MRQTLEALSDDTRRSIVALLASGERSAGELAGQFAISRPAVSRHLRVLREAGLVGVREDAQRRIYRLDPAPLAELHAWLSPYREFWSQRLDALDTELRRGRRSAAPAPADVPGVDSKGA